MLNVAFLSWSFSVKEKSHRIIEDLGSLSVQATRFLGLFGTFIFEDCQTVVYDPVYTCVLGIMHVMLWV